MSFVGCVSIAIFSRGHADVLRYMMLLFTLLTLPTIFGSFYASYRDVFPNRELAQPAEAHPLETPGP